MPTIDQKTINTLAGSDLSIKTREEFTKLIQTLGGSAVKLSENSGGAYVDFAVIEKNAAALGLKKENIEALRTIAGEVNNKGRNGAKLFLSVNDFMYNKSSPYAQGMSVEKQQQLFGIAAKTEGAAETVENGGQRLRVVPVKSEVVDPKPMIATVEKIQADTKEVYRQGGIQLLTQAGVTIDAKATFETVKAKVAKNEEALSEFDDAETLDDLETLLNNGDRAITILKGDKSVPVDAGVSDILIAAKYSDFSEGRLTEIADEVRKYIDSKGGTITVEDFNKKEDEIARADSSMVSNNAVTVNINDEVLPAAIKTIKDSVIYKNDADLRANFANYEDGIGHIQETSILNRILVALGKGTVDKDGAVTIDKKYSGITTNGGSGITLPQILSKIDEIDNGQSVQQSSSLNGTTETQTIQDPQKTGDKEIVFSNAANRLAKVFGTDVTVTGVRDFNGTPSFEIKFGNSDPKKADGIIDKLIPVRTSLGMTKDNLGFSVQNGPVMQPNGSIYLSGTQLLKYESGKWSVDEAKLAKLETKTADFSKVISDARVANSVQSTQTETSKPDLTLAKTPEQAVALAIYYGDSSYLNYTDSKGKKQTAFMDHDSFADKDGNTSLDKMIYPKIGGYAALLKNTDIEQEAAENGKVILDALKSMGKNPLDVPLLNAMQSTYGTLDARLVGYAVVVVQDYAQNGDGAMKKFDSSVVKSAYQYFADPKGPFEDLNAQMVATNIRPTVLSGIDKLLKRDQEINGTPIPVKK